VAQSDRGTITGAVSDPSGAVIPDATVTAISKDTAIQTRVQTTAAGAYSIPLLTAGVYNVTVEKSGFNTQTKTDLQLLLGQTVRVDFTLQVGTTTQSVEVRAEAPLLQTETTQLQTGFTDKEVRELPLAMQGESRSAIEFIRLVPGVVGAQTGMNGLHNTTGKTFATSINGGQTFSYELQIEGVSIQNTNVGGDLRNIAFPQEAISEFKLETNNFAAEYGRTGGGIITTNVRSGTREFHGSVFEYLRNNALDARGFFSPTVPTLRMNEFGGQIGGPIHKDKTYFFAYYDGFRYRRGGTNRLITLPTAQQRNGDFSDWRDSQGQLIPVYDPATTRPDGQGGFTRDQFMGCDPANNPQPNVICSDRFSQVARNVVRYIPATDNNSVVNNFLSVAGSGTLEDRWGVKIDHMVNQNHKVSGFFAWKRFRGTDPASVSPLDGPLSTGTTTIFPERILRLSYDWVISPNLVNHVGFGFNRSSQDGLRDNLDNVWSQDIGLTGVEPVGGFPRFNFTTGAASFITGASDYQFYGTGGGSDKNTENGFVFTDSLTWTKGRHTFKFGTDIRKNQENMTFQGVGAGQFNFSSNETSLPNSPQRALTGNPFASFLLGIPDSAFILVNPATYGNRYSYYSWFAQDSLKITPTLTLQLGLRYEIPIPRGETHDRMSTFDPSTPNPGAGGRPGALIYAGTGPGKIGKSRFQDADLKEFGPRFGLAYQLTPNTVLRGGYGIYYTTGGSLIDNGARIQSFLGYYAQPTITSSDTGVNDFPMHLDTGFPQNFIRPPSLVPEFANGSNADWINYPGTNRAPYVQNWNLTLQRKFAGDLAIEAAYVGSKGTRLSSRLTNPNQVDPRWLSLGSELQQNISCLTNNGCPNAIGAGVSLPYPGFSGSVAQALRPFPQYNNVFNDFENIGNSTYHAFQAKIEKRFSQNLNFLVAYTASKSIDAAGSQLAAFFSTGAQDQFNRRAEKAVSDNYIPHSLVFNYTYELPLGPGKRYGPKTGVAGKIIGGWQVSGIHEYQSGGLVNSAFGGSLQVPNTLPLFNYVLRPNAVPGQSKKGSWSGSFDPESDTFLNPAAFSVPAPFTFGNAARNYSDMRGFAYLNEDISILKRTYIDETKNIEFRVDIFNPLNRVVFANYAIGNIVGQPSYGKVGAQSNLPREIQFGLRFLW
jgi:outer membrane receptor protein involved in Fe transport